MIKPNYEIEAAYIRIKDKLADFGKGSDIEDEWIIEHAGIDGRRLEHRLRAHFAPMKLRRSGTHLHICTDQEQVQASINHTKKSRRQDEKALYDAKNVDRSKLSKVEEKIADHIVVQAVTRLASHEKAEREVKVLMGAPAPRPSLKAVKESA